VLRDLAVVLADGGDCLSDLAVLRDQPELFGSVASTATAWRVVEQVACDQLGLAGIRAARAQARARAWQVGAHPDADLLVVDVDGTLLDAHSDKQGAAGTYKHGYGFYPLVAFLDRGDGSGEALSGILRPGNAGSNTAADHLELVDLALAQLPQPARTQPVLVRADTGGATHGLTDHLRARGIRFSISLPADERVRAAVLAVPETAWVPATDGQGQLRSGAEVAELATLELAGWPQGTRAICRREQPHPGAQLCFTDADGHRFQVFITDQPDPDLATLELRHRQRARVEDRIRGAKATGLRNLPFDLLRRNAVRLELVLMACNLGCWTQALLLDPGAAAGRRARGLRTQGAALPAAACGCPRRPPRPPPDRAPAAHLAVGAHPGGRVHPPAGATAALLTLPRSRALPSQDAPAWLACPRRPPPGPDHRPRHHNHAEQPTQSPVDGERARRRPPMRPPWTPRAPHEKPRLVPIPLT
jgi:Transposase DDE domain group 1